MNPVLPRSINGFRRFRLPVFARLKTCENKQKLPPLWAICGQCGQVKSPAAVHPHTGDCPHITISCYLSQSPSVPSPAPSASPTTAFHTPVHTSHIAGTRTPAARPGSSAGASRLCRCRVRLRISSCRSHHRLHGQNVVQTEDTRRPFDQVEGAHGIVLDGDHADPPATELAVTILIDDVDGSTDVLLHGCHFPNMCLLIYYMRTYVWSSSKKYPAVYPPGFASDRFIFSRSSLSVILLPSGRPLELFALKKTDISTDIILKLEGKNHTVNSIQA